VVQEIDGIGKYLVQLDVLAPSFIISMIAAWVFSKVFPDKINHEIQELDEQYNPANNKE
jgi:hypothetical protein